MAFSKKKALITLSFSGRSFPLCKLVFQSIWAYSGVFMGIINLIAFRCFMLRKWELLETSEDVDIYNMSNLRTRFKFILILKSVQCGKAPCGILTEFCLYCI